MALVPIDYRHHDGKLFLDRVELAIEQHLAAFEVLINVLRDCLLQLFDGGGRCVSADIRHAIELPSFRPLGGQLRQDALKELTVARSPVFARLFDNPDHLPLAGRQVGLEGVLDHLTNLAWYLLQVVLDSADSDTRVKLENLANLPFEAVKRFGNLGKPGLPLAAFKEFDWNCISQ